MSRGLLAFRKEPQGLRPLGHEDELLTAEVEDDYDALNDETFGGGLDDGWEEVHEKFAELEDRAKHPLASLRDPLADEDPLVLNQDVVERSISHLGLEDDQEDDPAVVTYSKSSASPWPAEWGRPCPSPPPPAILQQQFGGSPKTETIWTPKAANPPSDDRLASLLWKMQQQSPTQHQTVPQTAPGRSPLPPSARTLEELERDMIYSACSRPVPIGSPRRGLPWGVRDYHADIGGPSSPRSYPGATDGGTPSPGRRGSVDHLPPGVPPPLRGAQPKSPQFRFSPGRSPYPPPGLQAGAPIPMPAQFGMSPPTRMTGPLHGRMSPGIQPPGFGGRLPVPPVPHPMLGRGRVMMGSPMLLNNPVHSQMPLPASLPFRPGFGAVDLRRLLYPRQVQHPLLNKNQVRFASPSNPHYQQHAYQTVFGSPHQVPPHHSYLRPQLYGNLDHRGSSSSYSGNGTGSEHSDDPYAGLMTQKEKDWLIKIQLLQVQPENPEVDDYYYVMFAKKKAERRESPGVDGGDCDKLRFIRPERLRTESKNYTPIQFERSLGKLQVVSVNYPRKILDMGVQRLSEEEDRKVPPDRDLLWFRQLLLDIEKLYSAVLEHEDNNCSAERRAEIAEKLFTEVQPSEERFVQLVGVRKGRSLVLRVLPLLKPEHQVATLAALLRHLSWLQRKDRQDGTLDQGLLNVVAIIERASLNDLIQLAASLLINPDAAFPSRFALRVACAIVVRAEHHFQDEEASRSVCNEIQRKWAKLLSEMVDLLIASLRKHDDGDEGANDNGVHDAAILLLLPHERKALASQLQRFAVHIQLADALSQNSAPANKSIEQAEELQLQRQHNGFGGSLYRGETVTAVD